MTHSTPKKRTPTNSVRPVLAHCTSFGGVVGVGEAVSGTSPFATKARPSTLSARASGEVFLSPSTALAPLAACGRPPLGLNSSTLPFAGGRSNAQSCSSKRPVLGLEPQLPPFALG